MSTLKEHLAKYTQAVNIIGLLKSKYEQSQEIPIVLSEPVKKHDEWDEFGLMERFIILRTDYALKLKDVALCQKKLEIIKSDEKNIIEKLNNENEKLKIAKDKLTEIDNRTQSINTGASELSSNIKTLDTKLAEKKKELYDILSTKSFFDKKLLDATSKDCKLLTDDSELVENLNATKSAVSEKDHELEQIEEALKRYKRTITRESIKKAKLDEKQIVLETVERLRAKIVEIQNKRNSIDENKKIIATEKKIVATIFQK